MSALPFEWNWRATGGAFGQVRRLPGFTIRQHAETGRFYVKRDSDGQTVSAGHASPDDAEHSNRFCKIGLPISAFT